MNNRIALLLLVLGLTGCTPPPTMQDGLASVPADEKKAFESMLADAQVKADQVHSTGVSDLSQEKLAVSFSNGHIHGLRISDSPLASMAAVEQLPELESLWFPGNHITHIEGLLKAAHLTELVLDGNPLSDLSPLKGLGSLQHLSLSHSKLSSLKGVQDMPALESLSAEDNDLATLDGMTGLPVLRTLDVAHNHLSTLPSAAAFPHLTTVDASDNQLKDGPGTAPPKSWDLKVDGNPRPANWAETAPSHSWSGGNPYGDTSSGAPVSACTDDAFETNGTLQDLKGIRPINVHAVDGANANGVTVELSVQQGDVKVYLASREGEHYNARVSMGNYGYNTGDATPGHPAAVNGMLEAGAGEHHDDSFLIQSVDGDAHGLAFKVYRK